MKMTYEQILEEAKKLSLEDKRWLISELERSCRDEDPEVMDALMPILEKRRADFLAGRSKGCSLEESMKRIRERLDAKIKQPTDH